MPACFSGSWTRLLLQTIFAWVLSGALLIAAYPLSAWLLSRSPFPTSRLLIALTSLALGTGTLTLVMFWLSLLGISLTLQTIIPIYLIIMLPGWILWRNIGAIYESHSQAASVGTRYIASVSLCIIAAAILFNAAYWPFSRDDAVAIYAHFGARMAETQAVEPLRGNDTLYEAYPIHIPLTYTFAYLASGWTNEYLARIFPALMSVGCLAAAYILAEMMRQGAGLSSAFLLAITPTFGRWASSGYVDLPMAFLITLSAIFVWRLWHTRAWVDALLAGLMMGLAAWTKNAALVSVAAFGLWLIWAWLRKRIGLFEFAVAVAAGAMVALAWYARNWIGAGVLIPDTVWTEQARASLDNLLILPRLYGLVGLVLLTGVVLTVIDLIRRRFDASESTLLLLWSLPLFAAWWIFASYDPRFILLILPILCVMTGIWIHRAWSMISENGRRRVIWPAIILVMALGLYTVWNSVEFKDELLRNPLMSDAAKHQIVSNNP